MVDRIGPPFPCDPKMVALAGAEQHEAVGLEITAQEGDQAGEQGDIEGHPVLEIGRIEAEPAPVPAGCQGGLRSASEKPEAANSIVKALRQVLRWAIDAEHIDRNPARDVPYLRGRPDGFHTWTVEEVEQYRARHPIGSKTRLALQLLLFTGTRRGDVVTLGRQMARDGWLRWTEQKGRGRKVKARAVPILSILQAVIDATPSGHMTYLVTAFGKPFTPAGFGNWFRRRCDDAGLPHCSAHGLRKAGATIAADNGATEHQLMAICGWDSPKQAAVYTRAANRRKLAGDAMHLLVAERAGNESVPPAADDVSHRSTANCKRTTILR
jgi:integrase